MYEHNRKEHMIRRMAHRILHNYTGLDREKLIEFLCTLSPEERAGMRKFWSYVDRARQQRQRRAKWSRSKFKPLALREDAA